MTFDKQQEQRDQQSATTPIDYLMEESSVPGNSGPFDVFDTFDAKDGFKDFLIFRVDTLDDVSPYRRELADESALESEATSYANLMAGSEHQTGIHYEVRYADTGALIHTTETTETREPCDPRITGQRAAAETATIQTRKKDRKTPCSEQTNQLRMAIS